MQEKRDNFREDGSARLLLRTLFLFLSSLVISLSAEKLGVLFSSCIARQALKRSEAAAEHSFAQTCSW